MGIAFVRAGADFTLAVATELANATLMLIFYRQTDHLDPDHDHNGEDGNDGGL